MCPPDLTFLQCQMLRQRFQIWLGARSGHRCIINERGDILVRPFPLEQRLFLNLRGGLLARSSAVAPNSCV